MIGKHLWKCGGGRNWRAKEERFCVKCGATVKLVSVPRGGGRIYCWMNKHGDVQPAGKMPRCEP